MQTVIPENLVAVHNFEKFTFRNQKSSISQPSKHPMVALLVYRCKFLEVDINSTKFSGITLKFSTHIIDCKMFVSYEL